MVATTADPVTIASELVELVLKYKNHWDDFPKLSEEELKVITDYLSASGFTFIQIKVGQLFTEKSEEYPKGSLINRTCPYIVVGRGYVKEVATGWLNAVIGKVVNANDGNVALAKYALEKLQEAIPLSSIQVTPEGDSFNESPPQVKDRWHPYFLTHKKDSDEVGDSMVGVHSYCGGWIENKKISETHHILHCRNCGLRVPFPIALKTYGELRQYFQTKLAQEEF